jgi:hypothetical protein
MYTDENETVKGKVRLRSKNLKLNTYIVKRSCTKPPLLCLYNCNYSMDSVLVNYSRYMLPNVDK